MRKCVTFVTTLLILFNSFSQEWTGAVSSDWNNAANWSSAPGNGDDIVIDPANYLEGMYHPVVSGVSAFTPAEIIIQNGAELSVNGTLNASDRVEVLGSGTLVTITNGSFSLNGSGNNARLIIAEDASIHVESGALNVGQRLLFELGGKGVVNGGTVTVGETIAIVDGSVSASSLLIQHGGTIVSNGEFAFENEAGNFFPRFEQHGGLLDIAADLVWLGAAPGSGKGILGSTGGTIHVGGNVLNDPASTMGMQVNLTGNTALLEVGGSMVQLLSGDSIHVANGAQWSDIGTVAWQNDGVALFESGAFYRSGNTTLNGAGGYHFYHVTVPAGRVLNYVTPAQLFIAGNVIVDGVFVTNSNRLILDGGRHQTVNVAGAAWPVYDLEVRNTATGPADGGYGVQLETDLQVNHSLQLVDGIVSVAPLVILSVADNALVSGGNDTVFIEGYVEKSGNDPFLFPLGMAPNRYRPLSIGAPASQSTVVTAAYINEPYNTLSPVESPLQAVSTIEYWDLQRQESADLFTVAIGWNDASQSGLVNCNDISLALRTATQWDFVPSTVTGLCSGADDGSLTSASALSEIGPLTIGFTSNVTQQSVVLCPGETYTVGTAVYDTSGVYIAVLTDMNGNDSTVVTVVAVLDPLEASVTNNVTFLSVNAPGAASYQWIDCSNGNQPIPNETGVEFHPTQNGSYAVVVKRAGCADSTVSVCATISVLGLPDPGTNSAVMIYPNPVKSSGELIVGSGVERVDLLTGDGRLIVSTKSNDQQLDLPHLSAGVYLVNLYLSDGGTFTSRLFVIE